MKPPINIVWSEGLLLTQQHFQQFHYYMEYYTDWLFKSNTAFPYGLMSLHINEEALLNGIFQLEKCQGFFKTGERIHLRETLKVPIDREGDVFLCLAEQSSIANLPGYACHADQPRYILQSQEVEDHYDPQRKQHIHTQQENYLITQDTAAFKKTTHLKIAEVLKNTVQGFYLSDEFVPACLNIFCWHAFESYLHQLLHYLKSILSLFDNRYYQIDSQLPAFLKQFLAKLQVAFFQKHYHPWQFYQDFYDLMAAISPLMPVSYDHDHLFAVFQYIDKKIRAILPTLTPKKVVTIALHTQGDSLFFSDNLDAVFSTNMALYLHVSFSLADPRMGLFCQQVKITAVSDIESTVNAALPGVQLLPVDPLPKEFKPQGAYLLLQATGKCWEKILAESQLAVFLTNDFLGVELKLMAREA